MQPASALYKASSAQLFLPVRAGRCARTMAMCGWAGGRPGTLSQIQPQIPPAHSRPGWQDLQLLSYHSPPKAESFGQFSLQSWAKFH